MINSFSGKFRFLSNFWPCQIIFDGIAYPSIENAYQAAKLDDSCSRTSFITCTPGQAKRLGRKIDIRFDWELIKVSVMRELIQQKFKFETELGNQLSLIDGDIVEGNDWGDVFWGVCNGVGQNQLGILLMEQRECLRNK